MNPNRVEPFACKLSIRHRGVVPSMVRQVGLWRCMSDAGTQTKAGCCIPYLLIYVILLASEFYIRWQLLLSVPLCSRLDRGEESCKPAEREREINTQSADERGKALLSFNLNQLMDFLLDTKRLSKAPQRGNLLPLQADKSIPLVWEKLVSTGALWFPLSGQV